MEVALNLASHIIPNANLNDDSLLVIPEEFGRQLFT